MAERRKGRVKTRQGTASPHVRFCGALCGGGARYVPGTPQIPTPRPWDSQAGFWTSGSDLPASKRKGGGSGKLFSIYESPNSRALQIDSGALAPVQNHDTWNIAVTSAPPAGLRGLLTFHNSSPNSPSHSRRPESHRPVVPPSPALCLQLQDPYPFRRRADPDGPYPGKGCRSWVSPFEATRPSMLLEGLPEPRRVDSTRRSVSKSHRSIGTGLSPAVILLSLSVWGKLLGVLGLLIAIPATCLLLAYYRRMLAAQPAPAATAPPEPPPDGGPPT